MCKNSLNRLVFVVELAASDAEVYKLTGD